MRKSLLSLLAACAVAATVLTSANGSQAAAVNQRTYAYGSHTRQALDAYWRPSRTPRAGLVLVHGGTWDNGGRGGGWASAARWYADRGLAVFSVDHRYNTDAAWPGPRDDVLSAIAWIKANASRFGVAPDRLVVMGAQAGGHLAASAGTYGTGGTLVRGVIGLSAITSPYRSWGGAPTYASSALRRAVRDNATILARCYPARSDAPCWSRWNDMVVKAHASSGDAPAYLLTAQRDTTVTSGHASDLAAALRAEGVQVTAETTPGSASGAYLLTTAVKNKTLAWIRARTATAAPAAARARPAPTAAPDPVTRSATVDGSRAAARAMSANGADVTEGTHAYGTHPRQRLDAYHRPGGAPKPALVIVHGGYWYGGDKGDWAATARWFVDRGYAVFSVNYRYDSQAGWKAQRDDVRSAILWVRSHASRFGVAPDRIVALGSSAGGHLVATLGTYGRGTGLLRGAVALSPPADPYRAYNDGQANGASGTRVKLRDNAVLLTRCHPDPKNAACWNRWKDAAAKYRAGAGDTPMYLLHSRDEFVGPAHSAQLCSALTAAHVSCTAEVVEGTRHAGSIFSASGTREKVLKWLRAHD